MVASPSPGLVNGVKSRGKAARGARVRRSRAGRPASGGLEHNSRYLTERLGVLVPAALMPASSFRLMESQMNFSSRAPCLYVDTIPIEAPLSLPAEVSKPRLRHTRRDVGTHKHWNNGSRVRDCSLTFRHCSFIRARPFADSTSLGTACIRTYSLVLRQP